MMSMNTKIRTLACGGRLNQLPIANGARTGAPPYLTDFHFMWQSSHGVASRAQCHLRDNTGKLDPARPKLSSLCEPEPTTIKLDTALEVSHLDIGMNCKQKRWSQQCVSGSSPNKTRPVVSITRGLSPMCCVIDVRPVFRRPAASEMHGCKISQVTTLMKRSFNSR
jgi:hypothetical protein